MSCLLYLEAYSTYVHILSFLAQSKGELLPSFVCHYFFTFLYSTQNRQDQYEPNLAGLAFLSSGPHPKLYLKGPNFIQDGCHY